jgi:superoxide reductase
MNFADILKGAEEEGKEKHVPFIEMEKGMGVEGADIVRIIVGKEVPHPNTVEHHIAWLELFGVKKGGQVVDLGQATFGPSYTSPRATFHVNAEEFEAFYALSYCNIHGLWQNSVKN